MKQKSIRFRLTVWYSLALAAGLALFAAATWISMWHSLLSDTDQALNQRAQSVQAFVNEEIADPGVQLPEEISEYASAFPPGAFLQVKDNRGAVVYVSSTKFPWQAAATRSGLQRIEWQDQPYRVLNRKILVNGGEWQVGIAESLETVDGILSRLRFLLLTLLPGVILIASLGGNWLSRRALKPVDQITEAARSIGISSLSERLLVPATGDELARLSETWNAMLSRLEDAVKRLSRFTADASHELRTPLAVIRATAEIAARRSRSEATYREALAQIVSETDSMTRLVEDLLFLARCDAETVEMPMACFELATVVEHVCSQLMPLAESKGIQLACRLPGEKVFTMGNEPAVRRLVLVLLDNAIKYSKIGGDVQVTLRESRAEVHLEIADSGPGIPESEMPQIFQRFYRAAQARDSVHTGSGLGLALAAGIAQQHGATIEVQSVSEKGSIFQVRFPSAPEKRVPVNISSEIHNTVSSTGIYFGRR